MIEKRLNTALLWAWIITLLAVVSNVMMLFIQVPGQQALPWLTLALFAIAFLLGAAGVRRAFGEPQVYRGKISGSIALVLVCLLFAFTVFESVSARQIPTAGQAPGAGQKAPEFTLADTAGKPVSLSSLLEAPLANSPRPDGKPRALLLIFYRGYW